MAEKTKKWRGGRFLLNDQGFHSTASIVAEIEDTRKWPEGEDGDGYELKSSWRCTPDVVFQITDCNKKIEMAIDWDTAAGRKNSLKKVDRMLKALTAFRDALADEQALYVERMKKIDRAKKTEED